MYKKVEFSREELFKKVWETPIMRLAQTIGVSDVALAKACRRAGIPLPGRGYWAKDERHRPPMPTLPQIKDSYYSVVSFQVLDPERWRPAKCAVGQEVPITVPKTLETPHPLVAKLLQEAKKAKTVDGLLQMDRTKAMNVRISLDMLDRTSRLLDALIMASEAKGYAWQVTADGNTTVTADGETMKVLIKERLTKRDLPPPQELKQSSGSTWNPNLEFLLHPRYEWVSTGDLSFQIDEHFSVTARKNWNDTRRTRLEDKLHEILGGFVVVSAAIKADREEREANRLRREEEERQRRARARQAEEQRRLRHKLVKTTERWENACRIRAFCEAVAKQVEDLTPTERAAATAWLEWAHEQADGLDPLCGDVAKLFSLRTYVEEWFSGYYPQQTGEIDWWSNKE